MDEILQCSDEILPTLKLSELASYTYDIDNFDEILKLILNGLSIFRYDIESARKSLNLLIATNYLLKHGATGFVDELRAKVGMF